MLIILEIPEEFKEHYNQDKFCDSLKRVEYDVKPCLVDYEKDDKTKIYLSGLYEVELIQMLIEAFNKSKIYTIYEYDVEDIKMARTLMKTGITPHDLREHKHDFEYISNIFRKEINKELDRSLELALERFREGENEKL